MWMDTEEGADVAADGSDQNEKFYYLSLPRICPPVANSNGVRGGGHLQQSDYHRHAPVGHVNGLQPSICTRGLAGKPDEIAVFPASKTLIFDGLRRPGAQKGP